MRNSLFPSFIILHVLKISKCVKWYIRNKKNRLTDFWDRQNNQTKFQLLFTFRLGRFICNTFVPAYLLITGFILRFNILQVSHAGLCALLCGKFCDTIEDFWFSLKEEHPSDREDRLRLLRAIEKKAAENRRFIHPDSQLRD